MQYSHTSIAAEYEYGYENFSENAQKVLSMVKSVASAIGSGLSKLFNKLTFAVAKLSKQYNLLFNKYHNVILDNRHGIDQEKFGRLVVYTTSYETNRKRLEVTRDLFKLLENIEAIVTTDTDQLDLPQIKKAFEELIDLGVNITPDRVSFKFGNAYGKTKKKATLEDHGYDFTRLIAFLKELRTIDDYATKGYYSKIESNLAKLSAELLKENKQLQNIDPSPENKAKAMRTQIKIMRIWWCSHLTKMAYAIATNIAEDMLAICTAVVKLLPNEKVGSVFSNNGSEEFISYLTTEIDIAYENLFNTTINNIYSEINKEKLSKLHTQFNISRLKDEEYRSTKKFIKTWSKHNKELYNENIKTSLELRDNDYTLTKALQKLNVNRVDKNEFKLCIVPNTTSFTSMNARCALYNSVLNAVNSIDRIVTEDDNTEFGTTLSKLLQQLDNCGYVVDINDKYISEYNTYIDIRTAFDVQSNKSLKDLDYTPNDIFRFATTMNKLKSNIYKTGLFLQDRLKTQPDIDSKQSENTTISGLLFYNLPNTNNTAEVIKNRLFRVALLNSIFQSICNYSFEIDYNTTINLLNTTIQVQG